MGGGKNSSFRSFRKQVTQKADVSCSVDDMEFPALNQNQSLAVVLDAQPISVDHVPAAPIVASYNDSVRPLLDCVDRLRNLKIMQEGIQLPTIVVVGDQSSGKSSVLESLAAISLPRGQGICTRVPLIMRLLNHTNPEPELSLEFNGRVMITDEAHVCDAIVLATDEIAGKEKGISNTPITLTVKKKGVPDLTMVDLPGITRVPVRGQPEDIYEQISAIIMDYISPEESIILNVISASVDFSTCESIRMSQKVDKKGERTLAVVTKADKAPEGLMEKVTADDVNIGLGYICVRNRIGEESYEEAREAEAELFQSHPLLSKIAKSMVSIPVLAQRLMKIQANIISKCLPTIVKKINDKLSANVDDLNKLPKKLTSVSEAMTVLMLFVGSSTESLRKVIVRGEFDEYPNEKEMHCTSRLYEMLDEYSNKLQCEGQSEDKDFLMKEIEILEEIKGIELPNFLPRSPFLLLLQNKIRQISLRPTDFVDKLWNYIEGVVTTVFMRHSENNPALQVIAKRAVQNLMAKKKEESINWVKEMIGMEMNSDYTSNPEYLTTWNKLMAYQNSFLSILNDDLRVSKILNMEELGQISFGHLRPYKSVVEKAFDLKMRITAYWKIVLRRLVDFMALHLLYSLKNLINKEIEVEIINKLVGTHGNVLEKMMEESSVIAEKRLKLQRSIGLLKESRDTVGNIIDMITSSVG